MKSVFERKFAAYFGGLLLSLAAMLLIMQAKRAFMPTFHEQTDKRDPAAVIAPGGEIKIVYGVDPGHFLIPGLPSRLIFSRKKPDGSFEPVHRLQYRDLVAEKVGLIMPADEGDYSLEGELYVCASPGVADCAKLLLRQEVRVQKGQPGESRFAIDLPQVAKLALEAGAQKAQN